MNDLCFYTTNIFSKINVNVFLFQTISIQVLYRKYFAWWMFFKRLSTLCLLSVMRANNGEQDCEYVMVQHVQHTDGPIWEFFHWMTGNRKLNINQSSVCSDSWNIFIVLIYFQQKYMDHRKETGESPAVLFFSLLLFHLQDVFWEAKEVAAAYQSG